MNWSLDIPVNQRHIIIVAITIIIIIIWSFNQTELNI